MERLLVKDKGTHNFSNYVTVGCGLELQIYNDYDQLKGIIKEWYLSTGSKMVSGTDFESLRRYILSLIKTYDLKQISKCKKDILVIYIDNLDKIRGFFEDYITEDFAHYVQVFDFIEFRDMSTWNKNLHTSIDIALYAQFLIDNVFIPEKYYYLTPNQRPRKKIKKLAKEYKDETAKLLYPDPCDYRYFKYAMFGGLCYCPYPGLLIDEPLIEIDMDSAYIFDFLVQKHVMSEFEIIDPQYWEYYLTSDTATSLGRYKITYTCYSNKCHCFKDMDGNRIEPTEYGMPETRQFILNNIDLAILMKLLNIQGIQCCALRAAKLDYLPEYMHKALIEEYTKKEELKQTLGSDDPKTMLQKVCVNGIYGDTIRKYDTGLEIKRAKQDAAVIPQWGIWTTSYCKAYLLGLGLQLDGWYYGDTDSIYCKDTPKNRQIIEEYNNSIRQETKEFCDKFGYDYNKLDKLGTFVLKTTIRKFKALTHKIYMYATKDNKMVLKAAGSNKKTVDIDERLFTYNKIPVGERIYGFVINKSYLEIKAVDEDAEALTELFVKIHALLKQKSKDND